MTTSYKVLGQINPSAATQANLYIVPGATSTVCSTLAVCNQGATTTFRVAVQPSGATLTSAMYLAYEASINTNDSIFLTLGVTLATTDVISVYANTANVSFSLFGSEIS